MSGSDERSTFGLKEALVAVRSVAAADVRRYCPTEDPPVGIVGVLDHELAERPEAALDAVQEARIVGVRTSSKSVAAGH
jgi:hypothetical protein